MGGRRRRKSGPCWRGETKDKGFAGWPTPTWAPARRGKGAGVGVAWRRTKALRGGQRQHGPPPARKTQALLAWRDEGVRLCGEPDANMGARRRRKSGPCWRGERQRLSGEADANMGSRAPRKKRRCWRGMAKDKGFPGRPTPTWAATGAENPGPVGVARRRTKASRRGQRQHGRPRAEEKASVLAWRGERQRLSGEANANMGSRAPRKRRRCWRGEAKDKGFARRPTPTWAAARQGKSAGVGVAWRKTKAFRGGPRQHGRPRAEEKASVLAWRGERQRLSGKANANMGGRRRRKSGPCWRGETKDKGFAGWPTPTWAPARRGKGAGVGVAWRRTKALRGGQRQHGPPPARKTQALLAWRDEGVRLCGEPDANMGARRRRKSGPCWRGSKSG